MAGLGCLSICGGSFFVIMAPGDGQTAMVAYPLWGIGAAFGLTSMTNSLEAGVSRETRRIVAALAMIAVLSVVWGYVASVQYESEWSKRQRAGSPTKAGGAE